MENSSGNSCQIVIGSKKFPVVVSLKEFKGNPLIDIRKFFLSESDGELKPTKKGISLQKNNYNILIEALTNSSAQINDWFDEKSKTTLQKAESTLKLRTDALEENRRAAQDFDVDNAQWKSQNFFEIQSLGGKNKVIFNSRHLFFEEIGRLGKSGSGAELELIVKLLLSYSKAKEILDGSEEYTAGELFKYLESEWGQILTNYLSSPRALSL